MAGAFLKEAIDKGTTVVIQTKLKDSRGKFGRVLGAVVVDGVNINEAMVDNFKGRMNMNISWHSKYLSPMSEKYICSKYNKVN